MGIVCLRTWLRLVMAILPVAAVVGAPQAPPLLVCQGPHFQVEVEYGKAHDDLAKRLGEEALAALEAAWPVLEKVVYEKAQQPAGGKLRVLRLHTEGSTFRREERRLSKEKVLLRTLCTEDGSEAHVLLAPSWSAPLLRKLGVPPTTRQNLVFAAAAQMVIVQLGAKADPWLAEVVGLGVMEAVFNPRRAYGVDAAYDSRRYYAHTLLPNTPVLQLRTMVEVDGVAADADAWDERWSNRALVAEQLALADAGWARKLQQKWRARKGPAANGLPVAERAEIVVAMLGNDWNKAQTRFAATTKTMRPVWQQSAEEFWREGEVWWMAGNSEHNANCYAVLPPPPGDFVVKGTLELTASTDGAPFRLQLDWDDKSMLGVIFEPPHVILSEWDSTSGKWTRHKEVETELAVARAADFRVTVAGGMLRVALDGVEVLSWATGKRGMHGAWGLAVGDCLVRLTGLSIEPTKAAKK